jgi:hypothetical protein
MDIVIPWGKLNLVNMVYGVRKESLIEAGDSWHSSKIIRADEKNAGII